MRNGSAKTLRGRSRQPGEPDRAYEIVARPRDETLGPYKPRPVRGTPPAPGMAAPTVQPPGTIRLVPSCDRYRYKQRKRAYRRGELKL